VSVVPASASASAAPGNWTRGHRPWRSPGAWGPAAALGRVVVYEAPPHRSCDRRAGV